MRTEEKETSEGGVHPRPPRDHEGSGGRAAERVPSSETAPVVASAAAAASVGHGLHWPQNHELAQISIPDLLGVVSHNALAVIPAERCVVFMYEKSTNLLSAQVSSADDALSDHEEELSFPPVMGVVSACFLQRRCLRMQEPNLHKAFHREYDVPNDMKMDSMILAPVTLHHRTVGVIQLLNRIDPDLGGGPEHPQPEEFHSKPAEQADHKTLTGDEEIEMKLQRTRAVQQRARIGFSAKDEQKMILFTSHVAQLLDNKLKLLAQVESIAKAREEKAKSAIELLNMMNEKLEYQTTEVPVAPPLQPKPPRYVPIFQPIDHPTDFESAEDPQLPTVDEVEPEAPQEDPVIAALFADTDMLKVMKGISRTQALFRGHHLRRVHRLSEALLQHRERRRQIRSTLVLQRATRRFLARKWRKKRRNAIMVIVRAIRSYQLRAGVQKRVEITKRQKRRRSMVVEIVPEKPEVPLGRNGGVGLHHTLLESDVLKFRQRFASALKIQRFFRGHRARKQVKLVVGFTNASKGVRNVVKLQSFIRGTIARTKVKKILQEKRAMRAANVVCMRLAASADTEAAAEAGHHAPTTRDCLYPLVPVQPHGAPHVVANRHASTKARVEEAFDELRHQRLSLEASPTQVSSVRFQRRRRLVVPPSPRTLDSESDTWLESRPLAPTPAKVSVQSEVSERLNPLGELTKSELSRLHPTVVFEVDAKKAKRCPAGVQHADDWLKQRRHHTSRRSDEDRHHQTDREEGSIWYEGSSHSLRKRAYGLVTYQSSSSPISSNQATALPLLTRNSTRPPSPTNAPLQVCLLPAGSHRGNVFKRPSEIVIASSAQPQTRTTLPPTGSNRRALTTR